MPDEEYEWEYIESDEEKEKAKTEETKATLSLPTKVMSTTCQFTLSDLISWFLQAESLGNLSEAVQDTGGKKEKKTDGHGEAGQLVVFLIWTLSHCLLDSNVHVSQDQRERERRDQKLPHRRDRRSSLISPRCSLQLLTLLLPASPATILSQEEDEELSPLPKSWVGDRESGDKERRQVAGCDGRGLVCQAGKTGRGKKSAARLGRQTSTEESLSHSRWGGKGAGRHTLPQGGTGRVGVTASAKEGDHGGTEEASLRHLLL